jgi:LysM repeat protein
MRLFVTILYILLLFPLTLTSYSQNTPVHITVSKEKAIIDGKTYLLHTVKNGETLFSIAKAYGVPQKEIIAANKEAETSLRTGQVLRIPAEQNVNLPPSMNSDNYIFHIVEAGQTVFSIAEKYNLTKEQIYKHNPEVEISPLQAGQVIKIPKNAEAGKEVNSETSFVEHKVKRKETLYSISKNYKITVDDIIALNPELNTSDIQPGQILKIPTEVKSSAPSITGIAENKENTEAPKVINFEPCTPNEPGYVHKVAFLLPLYLDENQTIADVDSLSGKKTMEDRLVYSRSRNPLEFYEGALLAIDSLKRAGYSFKVYFYDTGRDIQRLTSILNRKELAEMELFIGPFDTTLLEKTLPFAKANNIKVVSPLSQNNNLLHGNTNLYQINPAETSKIDAAVKYISTQKDKNVILYKSNRAADKEVFSMFEDRLHMLRAEGFQFKMHTGNKDGSLSSKLVTDKENLIVMPSGEETAVADLLRNMNYVNSNYRITVFGLPRWTTFSSIDISFLHNLQYEYFTSFFADYNKPVTKKFILNMRENFKTEPGTQSFSSQGYSYAFLGYDVTFYFLNALAKFGRNFESCLPSYQADLIQSDFHFVPSENGNGTMNHVVNIIRYNKDFTIIKIH